LGFWEEKGWEVTRNIPKRIDEEKRGKNSSEGMSRGEEFARQIPVIFPTAFGFKTKCHLSLLGRRKVKKSRFRLIGVCRGHWSVKGEEEHQCPGQTKTPRHKNKTKTPLPKQTKKKPPNRRAVATFLHGGTTKKKSTRRLEMMFGGLSSTSDLGRTREGGRSG